MSSRRRYTRDVSRVVEVAASDPSLVHDWLEATIENEICTKGQSNAANSEPSWGYFGGGDRKARELRVLGYSMMCSIRVRRYCGECLVEGSFGD